ncbi:transglutaminase TgpA family protein [Streptomyces sp. NPDC004838]
MSGRGRLALCSYAATLLAASAMLPLLDSPGWLVEAALLLGIQAVVGALARRVPLAKALTVFAQALAGLILLTVVFARGQAFFGVVPGPQTFARFGELLATGGQDIERYAIPAPASDGIRLMLIGGVLVIGLLVETLAVTFRSAAPAGLPLLALYSVAAGLAGGAASMLWFVLAASGYLLLLLAEGREKLSQWGRVFGGAPSASVRGAKALEPGGGAPVAPARTGRRIGVLALGVALAVPAALPALDGGLLAGTGAGEGSGSGGGGTISAVNPLVSLQDSLNQPSDREALRYRTNAPDTRDLYLRFVALDQFDGAAWKSSERRVRDVPDEFPQPAGLNPSVATQEIKMNISAADSYRQSWLPLPYPATEVEIDGRWRYEPTGRTLVGDRGQTTRGAQYSVTALLVKPTAQQLAAAPRPPADILREYTKVPDVLPDVVKETAERVTRGAANDYEAAVLLQDWFAMNGGFTYDTEVQSGTGVAAITRFLERKEGFCIHFSFSMAAMARTLGIPARVAVGFTPGNPQANGTMSVGFRDAHAWPELYFEGVGWTRFEPTPSRGSTPEYTRQSTPSGGATNPTQPEATASDAPSAAPSASDSCAPELRRLGECSSAAAADEATPTGSGSSSVAPLLIVLGVLVGVAVPLSPMLWRTRVTARRLGSGGRAPEDASARTLAAWLEVSDTAWDHGIPPDESLTARKTAQRIVVLGKLEGEAAEAVHRVAGAVEQVLYAPDPRPATGLADDVKRIRAGLSAGVHRGARVRALLLPRSSIRVIWAASARWTSLTDRWRTRLHAVGPSRWADALRLRRASKQRG